MSSCEARRRTSIVDALPDAHNLTLQEQRTSRIVDTSNNTGLVNTLVSALSCREAHYKLGLYDDKHIRSLTENVLLNEYHCSFHYYFSHN